MNYEQDQHTQIDVVVCSVDDNRFSRVCEGLSPLVPLGLNQIIRVPDAKSMSEGYNRGAALCSADWIIFCHDDISVVKFDQMSFACALSDTDVFGPCGTDQLRGANWYNSNPNRLHGSVIARCLDGTAHFEHQIFGKKGPLVYHAQALDGIFIAARKSVWKALKFNEAINGFTLYDIDFSYRAFLHKYRVAILSNLILFHDSHVGEFSAEKLKMWDQNQIEFCETYNFIGPWENHTKHEREFISHLPGPNLLNERPANKCVPSIKIVSL